MQFHDGSPRVIWSNYQNRVFGDLIDDQERLIYALREWADDHPKCERSLKLANKLEACVRSPIICSDEAETDCLIVEDRCKSRSCMRCSRVRALQLMARGLRVIEFLQEPRFITLTLKSRREPLRAQLKRLSQSFARLRRSAPWKEHVDGGLYIVEVTRNQQSGLWHPHLHALVAGKYFPQRMLSNAWQIATGDSTVVHISKRDRPSTLARYLAKYVAKGSDATEWPRSALAEFAVAIHGLRLVQTFGSLHAVKLSQEDDDPWPFTERVAYLAELERRALHPHHAVHRLIDRLVARSKAWRRRKQAEEKPQSEPEYIGLLKAVKLAITFRKPSRPRARQVQGQLKWTCLHAPPI